VIAGVPVALALVGLAGALVAFIERAGDEGQGGADGLGPLRQARHVPLPGALPGMLRARGRSGGGARSMPRDGGAGEVRRLASSARGGQPVVRAFEAVASAGGPWSSEARLVVAGVQQGSALHDALADWVERTGSHGARLVADAVVLADRSGGSTAEALDAVARSLAQRAELEREVGAAAASARASAMVLVAMPAAFALAIGVADPRVAQLLAGTPGGWVCLGLAAVLDAAGAWWMHRLVARVAR
jgi:tight adherence protein B